MRIPLQLDRRGPEWRLQHGASSPVNIRFISSLDSEDEIRLATAMISGLTKFLDELPIAYTIRLETAAGQVIEHHHAHSMPAMTGGDLLTNPAPTEKSASNGSNVSLTPLKTDGQE